jgi:hypothetical protein
VKIAKVGGQGDAAARPRAKKTTARAKATA